MIKARHFRFILRFCNISSPRGVEINFKLKSKQKSYALFCVYVTVQLKV